MSYLLLVILKISNQLTRKQCIIKARHVCSPHFLLSFLPEQHMNEGWFHLMHFNASSTSAGLTCIEWNLPLLVNWPHTGFIFQYSHGHRKLHFIHHLWLSKTWCTGWASHTRCSYGTATDVRGRCTTHPQQPVLCSLTW